MDAAEQSLLIKFLQNMTVSEKKAEADKQETPFYLKETGAYIEKMKARFSQLEETTEFNVGDIVVWKDGLRNRNLPEYGQPSLVVKKLDPPIQTESDEALSEELDIQLGILSQEGDFYVFNYDSNRFKIYKP